MATIANRSRFTVTVARRPDLARTFPYTAEQKAIAYSAELKGRGLAPRLARLDDRFEVKIRHKTGPDQCLTVGSYDEADLVVKQIESERRRGLFVDYTLGWKTNFADLLRRYRLQLHLVLRGLDGLADFVDVELDPDQVLQLDLDGVPAL